MVATDVASVLAVGPAALPTRPATHSAAAAIPTRIERIVTSRLSQLEAFYGADVARGDEIG